MVAEPGFPSSSGAPSSPAWPVPKHAAPHPGQPPSKRVKFDGPFGEEIRLHVEKVALLKGWSTSDTILFLLRQAMKKD